MGAPTVNKLKIAVQELRDHLGRDTRGVMLLEKLTTIANSQRTRCASLEESLAFAKDTTQTIRRELDAAQLEVVALRNRCETENAKRVSAESRARACEEKLAVMQEQDTPEPESVAESDLSRNLEILVKRVRKRYKRLPGAAGDGHDLIVDDFVRGFTNDEFIGLGMVAALCGFLRLRICLSSSNSLRAGDLWKDDEHCLKQFVRWFRSRIHFTKLQDDLYFATGGGVKRAEKGWPAA